MGWPLKVEKNSGKQERNHWDKFDPVSPPVEGIKSLGSDAMPRIIVGIMFSQFSVESNEETRNVSNGGYSSGAGSKTAGMTMGYGFRHIFEGLLCRSRRRG